MSSKGTPRVTIRIPTALAVRIADQVAKRNFWSREEPWTDSDFIRVACEEKLAKMIRSRRKANKRKALSGVEVALKMLHDERCQTPAIADV